MMMVLLMPVKSNNDCKLWWESRWAKMQIYHLRDREGRRVYIFRPGRWEQTSNSSKYFGWKSLVRWDPDKIALHDLFCAGYMLCEMVVREEETQVSFIFDDVWAQAVKKNQAHIDVGKKHKFSLKPSSAVIWCQLWSHAFFTDCWNREHHRRFRFWLQAS